MHKNLYEHPIEGILYIDENVPTIETAELVEESYARGCKCRNNCSDADCECVKFSGEKNYEFIDLSDTDTYKICLESIERPKFECGMLCKCVQQCGNRLVQYGPCQGLCVKETATKGFGLFTTRKLNKGQFICEYAGEVLSADEVAKRYTYNAKHGKSNYIFNLREYYGAKYSEFFVDACYMSNIGRYINHSCEPNCFVVPIVVDSIVPKLCIFTLRDIVENEELTYDYGVYSDEDVDKIAHQSHTKCECMSDRCRGRLPFMGRR